MSRPNNGHAINNLKKQKEIMDFIFGLNFLMAQLPF